MKRIVRILGIIFLVLAILIAGLATYVKVALPDVGSAPDLKVAITPERVAKGEYLANHVFQCMDCHSTRNWNEYSGPMVEGTTGKGGELFDQRFGFPGTYYAANITPAGIGNWTDGEIFRAITTGVRKNGKPIFPVMPYLSFGKADKEDVLSIIAYLRSIPAIDNKVPESKSDFPMNFILNTIPQKAQLVNAPPKDSAEQYGKYLVMACQDCHTPFEKGKMVQEYFMAGGRSFQMPGGLTTSANLTPDNETGIGLWNKEIFIGRFKTYRDSTAAHRKLADARAPNTPMPWAAIAGMTDEDLGAIYAYLRTLAPNHHAISKFEK